MHSLPLPAIDHLFVRLNEATLSGVVSGVPELDETKRQHLVR